MVKHDGERATKVKIILCPNSLSLDCGSGESMVPQTREVGRYRDRPLRMAWCRISQTLRHYN